MLSYPSSTNLTPATRDDSRKILVGLGVCCAVIMVVGFFVTGALIGKLRAWQVLPLPERFSELYFSRSSSDAAQAKTGHLTFVVHNHEFRTTHYRYQIRTEGNGKNPRGVRLGQGQLSLAGSKSATITRDIAPPRSATRTKIIVELNYEGIKRGQTKPQPEQQSIYFWTSGTGKGT